MFEKAQSTLTQAFTKTKYVESAHTGSADQGGAPF